MAKGRFGKKLKEFRIRQDLTLREFCRRNQFDPGNYSRIESGAFSPPGEEKVRDYAKALGVEVGSSDYVELMDLAHVDRGQLPREFMDDDEVLDQLPVIFRAFRKEPLTDEELEKFIDLVRKR